MQTQPNIATRPKVAEIVSEIKTYIHNVNSRQEAENIGKTYILFKTLKTAVNNESFDPERDYDSIVNDCYLAFRKSREHEKVQY